MLDAFIIETLSSIGMPPMLATPPAISRSWDHQEVTVLQREIDKHIAEKAREFDDWKSRIDKLCDRLNSIAPAVTGTPEQIAKLDECITTLEEKADQWIIDSRRGRNQLDIIALNASLSDDRRALFRSLNERTKEVDGRFLTALVEQTALIRSFRAQVAPDRGSGPTFDNADDLERYLASV